MPCATPTRFRGLAGALGRYRVGDGAGSPPQHMWHALLPLSPTCTPFVSTTHPPPSTFPSRRVSLWASLVPSLAVHVPRFTLLCVAPHVSPSRLTLCVSRTAQNKPSMTVSGGFCVNRERNAGDDASPSLPAPSPACPSASPRPDLEAWHGPWGGKWPRGVWDCRLGWPSRAWRP